MPQARRVKWTLVSFWLMAAAWSASFDDFVAAAKGRHGDAGERAARFLVEHMPPSDRETLTAAYLTENLDLALQARARFPWGAKVPEEIFLNDVLPYAVFDETRDPWRAELYGLAGDLVKDATTASEAAQALNRELFKLINVHYNTGRKRPNQSYRESKDLGKATCTGLSIILVEACRAVSVPARAVGTPLWTNQRGNHTWVEIWDGDWHFTGADEHDAAGLDRGWFVGDAAKAQADVPRHAIYATSWRREGLAFPMVWARGKDSVAAVNVTARYAKPAAPDDALARLGVRLWDRRGGSRLVAAVTVADGSASAVGPFETKAGSADLNDMPRLTFKAQAQGKLRFARGAETRDCPFGPLPEGDSTLDAIWPDLDPVSAALDGIRSWLALAPAQRPKAAPALEAPLSRAEAEAALRLLAADRRAQLAAERQAEVDSRSITLGEKTLRWDEKVFGEAPAAGRRLWISMHGGGNAPARVNDRQWQNQVHLYEPAEGIYLAPRAPTDTWNLWHESHIDPLFQRLIDDYVALRGVDPDAVYLLGYSAGGDGVWQLAPRMADRFAAAAMMAGHPNEASVLGLRNLPFALFVGGNDGAYNRNRVVAERAAELDRLEQEDPGGYVHMARVYEGLGHWMNKQDAEALPWMATFQRTSWPSRVVWQQDDVVHRRFYWLQVPEEVALKDRAKIVAAVKDQAIRLEGDLPSRLHLRLSDQLLDLDKPITVVIDDRTVFSGTVPRTAAAIVASLAERADAASAATATLPVP